MKILVPVKRVLDYNIRVRVKADQSDVDLSNCKMSINPFCEIAVEQAVRLKEAGQSMDAVSEIIVVSVGPDAAQETLRSTLALGADRAILVKTDNDVEPLAIAKILKKIVQQYNIDLVITGKQAIDNDCNQTAQMLAGLLNWPQGTFISKLAISNGVATITREVDGGLETLQCELPCVISTDLRLNVPRFPKLPNIMKAKQKPLEIQTIDFYNVSHVPRHTLLKVTEPPVRKVGKKVANVIELVDCLRHQAKVI